MSVCVPESGRAPVCVCLCVCLSVCLCPYTRVCVPESARARVCACPLGVRAGPGLHVSQLCPHVHTRVLSAPRVPCAHGPLRAVGLRGEVPRVWACASCKRYGFPSGSRVRRARPESAPPSPLSLQWGHCLGRLASPASVSFESGTKRPPRWAPGGLPAPLCGVLWGPGPWSSLPCLGPRGSPKRLCRGDTISPIPTDKGVTSCLRGVPLPRGSPPGLGLGFLDNTAPRRPCESRRRPPRPPSALHLSPASSLQSSEKPTAGAEAPLLDGALLQAAPSPGRRGHGPEGATVRQGRRRTE